MSLEAAVAAVPAEAPAAVVAPAAGTAVPVTPDPAAAPAPVVVPPVAVAPVRPEGLADEFWDPATGVKAADLATKYAELSAAEAARKADLPADATGYKLELPEPILDAAGQPVKFNADDPLAKSTLAWAHENGVPQAALTKLLGAYAANAVAETKANNEALAAETAKLGAEAPARFTAARATLTAALGPDATTALMSGIGTAAAFTALEALLKGATGPAIGSPTTGAPATTPFDNLFGADRLAAIHASKRG